MTKDTTGATPSLPAHGFARRAFASSAVQPRRTFFSFPPDIPRHWVGADAARTHLMNSLHLFLPSFEKMIIRNIKEHVLPVLHDEDLRRQATGLLGQEAMHSKAHALFLANLRQQGFRIDGFLSRMEWLFEGFMARRVSPRLVLAGIAAFEHYTDLLVDLLADTDFLDGCEPILRELLLWHAAEEVEHHAIPFQLLRAVGGGYLLRQAGNVLGLTIIYGAMLSGAVLLMWQDRTVWKLSTWKELGRFAFGKYAVVRKTFHLAAQYMRPSYDPAKLDRTQFARWVLEASPGKRTGE